MWPHQDGGRQGHARPAQGAPAPAAGASVCRPCGARGAAAAAASPCMLVPARADNKHICCCCNHPCVARPAHTQTEDGLLHVQFWSREVDSPSEPEFDEIVFPEEAVFEQVCVVCAGSVSQEEGGRCTPPGWRHAAPAGDRRALNCRCCCCHCYYYSCSPPRRRPGFTCSSSRSRQTETCCSGAREAADLACLCPVYTSCALLCSVLSGQSAVKARSWTRGCCAGPAGCRSRHQLVTQASAAA